MNPAIIEAAARALYEANLFAGPQTCEVIVTAVTPLIEAAALERAAMVAENIWEISDRYRHDAEMAAEQIADAIRALNKPMEKK